MIQVKEKIEAFFRMNGLSPKEEQEARQCVGSFLQLLDEGVIRPVAKEPAGWKVNSWVKEGILLAFRLGVVMDMSRQFPFFDKSTFPLKEMTLKEKVRIVPGGTSIRKGAYVAPGVVIMPPAYINTGSYVGEGTLVDSHALIGSCAQIGRRCHISAGAQIGGVLEPVNARPVIIEDEVLVGGNCGLYEGVQVGRRAVLAAGVILTGSTPLYDLCTREVQRPETGRPLTVPEGAVVIQGSRPLQDEFARGHGLQAYTPIIVKYRDEKTEASVVLEEALRDGYVLG
ncbi:MAG TPA: 2,3,4,5-tetrahydropyridine-2,6-dicarboxylate N-succinyltransferase [Candidatus Mcinerneyibacteriales bacterium]|nr:2,3,4,5-tetrahydropyridine-2,6-dicarboxylate N-succinyltransferase [Candidatus Mcinerneyibacteriales bacterium]